MTQGNVAAGAQAPGRAKGDPDCSGVKPETPDPQYLCGDWRLGPAELPTTGAVANLLTGYDRLAGMTPLAFLTKYWVGDVQTGHWNYPPDNGFVKGKFVKFNEVFSPRSAVE